MQRRFPQSTVTAAVGGLTGGTAIGLAVADDAPTAHDISVVLLPVAFVTAVATRSMQRWLRRRDEQTREAYSELAERRIRLDKEHGERLTQLAEREAKLTQSHSARSGSVAILAKYIGDTLGTLARERAQREQLQRDYETLAGEYNDLVQEAMQERADRFNRTAPPEARPGVPRLVHARSPVVGTPSRRRGERSPADGTRDRV
ncbi:hypothetical protein PV410_12320 [Streptomyces sp. PA03-5A]|nr:hypothetical protein [Streptomyces sp. PA03-5A]